MLYFMLGGISFCHRTLIFNLLLSFQWCFQIFWNTKTLVSLFLFGSSCFDQQRKWDTATDDGFSHRRRSNNNSICKRSVIRVEGARSHHVECLRPATLLKKRLWRSCFPENFPRTPFLQNTSRRPEADLGLLQHPRWSYLW